MPIFDSDLPRNGMVIKAGVLTPVRVDSKLRPEWGIRAKLNQGVCLIVMEFEGSRSHALRGNAIRTLRVRLSVSMTLSVI